MLRRCVNMKCTVLRYIHIRNDTPSNMQHLATRGVPTVSCRLLSASAQLVKSVRVLHYVLCCCAVHQASQTTRTLGPEGNARSKLLPIICRADGCPALKRAAFANSLWLKLTAVLWPQTATLTSSRPSCARQSIDWNLLVSAGTFWTIYLIYKQEQLGD